MKISLVHVPYEYSGGEDQHVKGVERIYRENGWEVTRPLPLGYSPGRPGLAQAWESLKVSEWPAQVWGQSFIRDIEVSDFIHLHNPYPILGVHFLEWCRKLNKKILWTIHNHRFFCSNGLALRKGKICLDCFSAPSLMRPIFRNCNDSLSRSTYYSMAIHQLRATGMLDSQNLEFLAPSPYIEGKLLDFGIDASRVHLVPNPVQVVPGVEAYGRQEAIDVLYCGRLSQEKGIEILLGLAKTNPDLNLFLAGDGPLKAVVENCSKQLPNLRYLGRLGPQQVADYIECAKVIVLPSICNEILPTFLIEGLISGKTCVASNMESLLWLADKPFSVNLFRSGDLEDLARVIRKSLTIRETFPAKDEVRKVFSETAFLEKIERVLES